MNDVTEKYAFTHTPFFENKFLFMRKGGRHRQENMIQTQKFRFLKSMTLRITEKRKIAIFQKSDLYHGGHMTS